MGTGENLLNRLILPGFSLWKRNRLGVPARLDDGTSSPPRGVVIRNLSKLKDRGLGLRRPRNFKNVTAKRVKRQFYSVKSGKKLAATLVSSRSCGPAHKVLEGGHLHHRGQLWLDLLPPLMEDTGIVLSASVTPEDTALEQPGAFDDLQHLSQCDISRRPSQGVAPVGAAERADHAVLSQFLENLGRGNSGGALGPRRSQRAASPFPLAAGLGERGP